MDTKVDLHVHSKFSDRPSEWILRRVGAPESFVEPIDVYRRAKQRGMQFVTISDHNCIEGALEIAHLPGTFLSTEVTTYFPEDGCKIHCLVSGITERQFKAIEELRENIYDFRNYVLDEEIVYSVAHPLFRVNDQLTVEHLERLILLFNRFEGINGTRDRRASDLILLVLRNLSPAMIEEMSNRHDIEPVGPTPWIKTFTAGSDDHGGLYIASAYTTTPACDTVDEFLEHLRQGRHDMGGTSGTSLRLAHSFYQIAYDYYKSRLLGGSLAKRNFIDELFGRVIGGRQAPRLGLRDRMRFLAQRIVTTARGGKAAEESLASELSQLLTTHEAAEGRSPDVYDDRHSFQIACRVCHLVGYQFLRKFVKYASQGRLVDSLQTISSLGPVALSMAPYLAAFRTQHKDELFLQAVANRFEATRGQVAKSEKKVWVTDTFSDTNGVSLMIQCMGKLARQQGKQLTVLTSLEKVPDVDVEVKNFAPVGAINLPEYESQQVCLPPFLEIVEYLERERVGQLIISTPGPMGLTALAAGRLLGIPMTGIYHTDFPKYVRMLTQDETLEQLTWRYMCWFYDQMQTIYAPSEFYRQHLVEGGFDSRKVMVLKRGVDIARFSPEKRRPVFWNAYGLRAPFVFAYVGRVSKEKNLDHLLESFLRLKAAGAAADLAIVGDGPQLPALRARYERPGIAFTGFLGGDDLAHAYASADAFVFPSTTDTFGNAVLEAQASGLPAIVSDQGGPAEVIQHERTGLVFSATEADGLLNAMRRLLDDRELCQRLGAAGTESARTSSWEQVLEDLWTHRPRIDAMLGNSSLHRIRAVGAAGLANLEVA